MDGADDPVERLRQAVLAAGIEPELVRFQEPVPTASAAAQRLGCEVGAIANSLVFTGERLDGTSEPVLVLASGAHRVDTTVAAAASGLNVRRLRRATAEFVLEHTGQVVGGVGPTGHPTPLRTIIDADLAAYERLWAGAGDRHTMMATSMEDLVRLTGGVVRAVR